LARSTGMAQSQMVRPTASIWFAITGVAFMASRAVYTASGERSHRGAGDALANRELPDRCAPYETATARVRRLLFQAVAERWQSRIAHI
jgi:hypothetical protein